MISLLSGAHPVFLYHILAQMLADIKKNLYLFSVPAVYKSSKSHIISFSYSGI